MADNVKRQGGLRPLRACPKCGLGMPDSHVCKVQSNEAYYKEAYRRTLESERKLLLQLSDIAALHADIIDQGRKVQIAASGESKYGAMSAGDYIEWVLGKLEGK
jgi:hypothetical protein